MFGKRDGWVDDFVRDGFAVFPGLLDAGTVADARRLIDSDLAANYDPARKVEYDNRTFCPDIVASDEIMALVRKDSVQRRVGMLVNRRKLDVVTTGQIAIRRAHNVSSEMPGRDYPPEAHVDGYPTPHNGVGGNEVVPFTLLIGVFLSDATREFAGNFTVWPGSHRVVEEYFRREGAAARSAAFPKLPIGEPKQLICSAGDVVISHYQLAHTAAVNTSDDDRYAVFFRLAHRELGNYEGVSYRDDVWEHLTKIWSGWKVGN